MPHDKLGEDVAAASCCGRAAMATEAEMRDFVQRQSSRISRCRERIVILDEIPKGATGKLQRIGLAQKLGLA